MTIHKALKVPTTALAIAALAFSGCAIDPNFENPDDVNLNRGGTGDDDDDDDGGGDDITLRGYVRSVDGIALGGVDITVTDTTNDDEEPWSTSTDETGRFELPDLSDGDTVNMSFELDGYAPTSGAYTATADGMNFFSHTLAPVDVQVDFESGDGWEATIDGTHNFLIPGSTVENLDGTPYTGTVSLTATVWDRTTPLDEGGEFMASPGNGQGTTAEGTSHLLYTFGMFQLGLQSSNGDTLQPGTGFQMTVELPDNSNLPDGQSVPYWTYNAPQNTWEETDAGQIVELIGGGQAWEFTPTQGLQPDSTTGMITGNPDHPIIVQVTGQAQGTVTNQMGQPQPGVQVRVVSEDLTYMQQTTTNSQGQFSVNIPPVVSQPSGPNGRPIFIEIDYLVATTPAIYRTDAVPAPGPNGVVSLGNASLGSISCVSGQVLDVDGRGVGGVAVLSPHGGNSVTEDDGSFTMNVPKWQPSTVYAAARESSRIGYEPVIFRPRPEDDTSCPNAVTLRAYSSVGCANGQVSIEGFQAEGLTVDAFDARFPSAPIFSTTVTAGSYCVTVPTSGPTVIRVGAGDLAEGNACGSYTVNAIDDGPAECGSQWCESVPSFDCGE
jgi:hypothetical protein